MYLYEDSAFSGYGLEVALPWRNGCLTAGGVMKRDGRWPLMVSTGELLTPRHVSCSQKDLWIFVHYWTTCCKGTNKNA